MDLGDLGFAVIPAIVVICYLVGAAVKLTALDNKWIPIICGICGGILGAVYHFINAGGGDIISSIATGIVSGLAATGANQVGKQLKSGNGKS